MPWEKAFDVDTAIDNAMLVFWEKGYEPASITDLLEGTGLNRGSLYNAFGGKKQLFVDALKKYDQDYRRPLISRLEALDDPRQAIEQYLDTIVSDTLSDRAHKGCFLVNTALEYASHDAEVNGIVSNGFKETEAFLRRCIEVGQARNQIPKTIEPSSTATAILGLSVSVRVLGRGVFGEEALGQIALEGKRMIQPQQL